MVLEAVFFLQTLRLTITRGDRPGGSLCCWRTWSRIGMVLDQVRIATNRSGGGAAALRWQSGWQLTVDAGRLISLTTHGKNVSRIAGPPRKQRLDYLLKGFPGTSLLAVGKLGTRREMGREPTAAPSAGGRKRAVILGWGLPGVGGARLQQGRFDSRKQSSPAVTARRIGRKTRR